MTPQKSVTKITGDTLELLQKRGNTTQSFTIYNEKDLDRTIKNQSKILQFDMKKLEEEYDYETD
jgi:Holliday junction resolvasome RuvABC ATP-dependent DNA helicase subunit